MISGLIFKCPFNNEKDYCPFKKFRKLSVEKKVKWLMDEDNEDEKIKLLNFHTNCLIKREKENDF
jgi:hypothetical protein